MNVEIVLLCGYAVGLVVVASGVVAVGRRSTDPWSSPVLAGSRPAEPPSAPEPGTAVGEAAWPDRDVPAFHTGLAAVALVAALVLTGVAVLRHRDLGELLLGLAVGALVAIRAAVLIARRPTSSGRSERSA